MRNILLVLLIGILNNVHAQDASGLYGLKGKVYGGDAERLMPNANVALLNVSDSSLLKVTFTDREGFFILDKLRVGSYKICVSYIGYRPVWKSIAITSADSIIDFGVIHMQETGITIGEIEIVKKKRSIILKKDTLEFNVASYKAVENSVVEEVLRAMPGVTVEDDGTVKINGVVVKRLLLNGKPFFGDDPKMGTKNLPADIIEKIQFIDAKSSWSQFTGINDGQREKTVNIIVKEEKNRGSFGRLGGALATGGHFACSGNLNYFNGEQQMSFWSNGTDINGYQENGARSRITTGGNGNVRNWSGGGSYANGLNERVKIGGDYSLSNNYWAGERKSERQNILLDTTWYYNQNSRSENRNVNQALNAWAEIKPDSVHILNIFAKFNYGSNGGTQESLYSSFGSNGQLMNSGNTLNSSNSRFPDVSSGLFFGKRFKKVGRTVSINLAVVYNTSQVEELNKSTNVFVDSGSGGFTDSIDQMNYLHSRNKSMTVSFAYTEPLSKNCFIEFDYSHARFDGSSDKFVYDYNPIMMKYDRLDDSLSSVFRNKTRVQQLGTRVLRQGARYNYNIGLNIQFKSLDNNNIRLHSQVMQRTIGFFPSATMNYNINVQKYLQFSYSGSTQNPGFTQLQPVPNNNNPLYAQLGNPNLKPAFNNHVTANYNVVNSTTLLSFSTGVSSEIICNKIVNASKFDSIGRQIDQAVNVNGSYNINANASIGVPLKKKGALINASMLFGINQDVGYVGGERAATRNFNINTNVIFNYNFGRIFNISTKYNVNYGEAAYTLQRNNNNWILNWRFSLDINSNLPVGLVVGGNLDYMKNTGKNRSNNEGAAVLNLFITKTIFKKKMGLIRIQGFDLLNENTGISRILGLNYIEDNQTIVQQRFFLIGFSYFISRSARNN